MNDFYGKAVNIGDVVVFSPGGSYAGICIGEVAKITKKQIAIKKLTVYNGRHLDGDTDKLYYTYSELTLIIDKNKDGK